MLSNTSIVVVMDVNETRLARDSKKISSSRIIFLLCKEFRESEQSATNNVLFVFVESRSTV